MTRTKNTTEAFDVLTPSGRLVTIDVARFMSFIHREPGENGCWKWIGPRFGNGYGRFYAGNNPFGAHRVAYMLWRGPIAKGQCVCHDCPGGDNRWCVNPDHLWLGDKAANAVDSALKGRNRGNKPIPEVRVALAEPYPSMPISHPGESNPWAKLTDDDVRAIRARYSFRKVTAKMLAEEYGVSAGNIKRILQRKAWTHLD